MIELRPCFAGARPWVPSPALHSDDNKTMIAIIVMIETVLSLKMGVLSGLSFAGSRIV